MSWWGAAVSLRDSMALLVHDPLENGGLDWAHLDCQSCHHDLKSPSWRQERYMERTKGKGKAKLGRVTLRSWSPELARLAIHALPPAEAKIRHAEFGKLMADLEAGFQAKAFGDPVAVKKAAQALEAFADGLARKLDRPARFAAKDAKALLASYPEVFAIGERLIDFDASRQIAWSFRVIRDELSDMTRKAPDKALSARLEALDKTLRLDMTKKGKGEKLEESYKETARSAAQYDPRKSKDVLRGLRLPLEK